MCVSVCVRVESYSRRHDLFAGWSGGCFEWSWEQRLGNTTPCLAGSDSSLIAISSFEEGSGIRVSCGRNSSREDPGGMRARH